MNAVAEKTVYTPEDLLAMPDEADFELVDGELVERLMSSLSSWIGGRIYRLIADHVEAQGLGFVWPADNGYQCFPKAPGKVRKPDVSFVHHDRLPEGLPPEGYLRVAPDLAVEVLSPNDLAIDLDVKLIDYRDAGVRLTWVLNPESRSARVYGLDGSSRFLAENDDLSGEDVLPGFSCRVDALFPTPTGDATR